MDIGLGAAAFWIAVAAVMVAGGWFRSRNEELKQQTLLRLVERTGQVDDQLVKTLFPPPSLPSPWGRQPDPDGGWIALRVLGTIVLSVAVGLAIFFTILQEFGTAPQQEDAIVGFASTSIVACVGVGLLVASRLVRSQRLANRDDRQAP